MSRTQVDACQRGPEIRQACYSDHAAIRDFLGGLSLRARYLRFFTGALSTGPAMLRILAGGGDHIDVVVAIEGGVIIGHAMASDAAGADGVPVTEIGVVVTDARQGQALRRFRLLLDAYGLTRPQRREVAEAILDNHDWCCAIITEAVNAGHPGFADYWGRVAGMMARARRWCEAHHHDLLASVG